MPQIAPITILDGQATPVSHVFNPIETMPVPRYARNGVNVPVIGTEGLKITTKRAGTANGVNKVDVELWVPVLEQPTGGTSSGYVAAPGVAHELRFKGTFFCHQRSDKAGRKDLRVMSSNVMISAAVAAAVDDLEAPY